MSDEYFTGPQAFFRARQHLQDRFENANRLVEARAATLDRTLLTLSGGALALSITLVCRPDSPKGYLCILFLSWTALTISLISVVIALWQSESDANKILSKKHKDLKDLADKKHQIIKGEITVDMATSVIHYGRVRIFNLISLCGFVAGVILLAIYAVLNLATAK